MTEPDYIAQAASLMNKAEALEWSRERVTDASLNHGCTFFRQSLDPDADPPIWLIEGWVKRPEDQGPIRWQLEAKERKE